MTIVITYHEVADGKVWANAWRKGPGSRHEMFSKHGVKARTFRNPQNQNQTGLYLEVPDMDKFMAFLQTEEGQRAMKEDGLNVASLRVLTEFTP